MATLIENALQLNKMAFLILLLRLSVNVNLPMTASTFAGAAATVTLAIYNSQEFSETQIDHIIFLLGSS